VRQSEREPGSAAIARGRLVSKEPIHEQILPHIRQDIVQSRWQPGERLPEPQLCREFGVSRTPLRDALKILEAEGLVRLHPHVGAVVTPLDPPDLADKLEVLSALEQAAAMKVARTRPAATIADIARLHAAMGRAARAGAVGDYYRLNDSFHRAIVLGAQNPSLARMHEMVMWHIHRARLRANEHERLTDTAAEHHSAIVTGIATGAPDAAGQAMREHLEEVARTVLAQHRGG
jgi:DNA-binding GntR family transcriptional regulator